MGNNFTHHRYYAWLALVLRLHSPLVRYQLPRYPRRHIRQHRRICHGAIRPCLGASDGHIIPFNSFHGWHHVDCSGAGGLVFFYPSAYLHMMVSRIFLYTVMQCDAIPLFEMDLANGGLERDLVFYLLAWDTLMLLIHNESTCFENTMGTEIDIPDWNAEDDAPRWSRYSDDINIRS
jgi:hypothetical protein